MISVQCVSVANPANDLCSGYRAVGDHETRYRTDQPHGIRHANGERCVPPSKAIKGSYSLISRPSTSTPCTLVDARNPNLPRIQAVKVLCIADIPFVSPSCRKFTLTAHLPRHRYRPQSQRSRGLLVVLTSGFGRVIVAHPLTSYSMDFCPDHRRVISLAGGIDVNRIESAADLRGWFCQPARSC